ncbi:MAG: histidine kinase [Cyanobacteriota bacterium]|jgi:two-component system clock-associated histidine kinase SasA
MLTPSRLGFSSPTSLQFLLFVDERPYSQDNAKTIFAYLKEATPALTFELQILEIQEHPHLVEHFRLVATPSLVKVFPEPKQTLAGSNIVQQLRKWWPRWEKELQFLAAPPPETLPAPSCSLEISEVGYSGELMKMADEIFQLKQERTALLEQLRFKDQILAMLAHDLRSPLTAASIAVDTLELIEQKPVALRSPRLREQLVAQTRKQFQVMNRLITDILQASRNMNAHFQVNCEPLLLQESFREVLELYHKQFQEKRLTLVADLPQDAPPVFADEELLRQVMVNLLDNAIKYTPEGGVVTVSLLHRTTQKVQVSVADTGPGIPESKQETIFEGHFRLQRDEGKDGYGLGLSLCRKIIQAHYGQIWVDSVPGQGSSFHFTLPVHR